MKTVVYEWIIIPKMYRVNNVGSYCGVYCGRVTAPRDLPHVLLWVTTRKMGSMA